MIQTGLGFIRRKRLGNAERPGIQVDYHRSDLSGVEKRLRLPVVGFIFLKIVGFQV